LLQLLLGAGLLFMTSVVANAAQAKLTPITFQHIEGWASAPLDTALATFQRSCAEIAATGHAFGRSVAFGGERQDWLPACQAAERAIADPRKFFEEAFVAFAVADAQRPEGLFTGYYEPEALGSRQASAEFAVPIYARPADLVSFDAKAEARAGLRYGRLDGGQPKGYFTRREIETGALAGRGLEIVWLKDWADAFFIHIQGSGRVRLADGSLIRLAYAAKSGQPYTGIGRVLVDRGILSEDNMSMQAIRAWMKSEPKAAREVMWENRSFVFFREVALDDPALGPPGAQKVNLTPLASLAVDRGLWMFGTPIWLDTKAPSGPGQALRPLRGLFIAQDTGTAIKGAVRGDVFWGAGEHAALTAGHMKSPGRMIVLLPKPVAARLGL
jgi:membrane-bound lytic murein transglycosylase A